MLLEPSAWQYGSLPTGPSWKSSVGERASNRRLTIFVFEKAKTEWMSFFFGKHIAPFVSNMAPLGDNLIEMLAIDMADHVSPGRK